MEAWVTEEGDSNDVRSTDDEIDEEDEVFHSDYTEIDDENIRNVIEQTISSWFMGRAIHSRVNVDVVGSFYNGKLVSPGYTSCLLSMRNLVNKFYSRWSNKYTLDKRASILDLSIELQDLQRFLVINCFASFHGRGQVVGIQLAAYALRPSPKRYVTTVLNFQC
ncbi:hypothetical protein Tco_1056047 [Tanacetum coccineum]|uniref:Uncharacterized protein n=1 Tax=Tanacetum coccineum TaxID=301880 RepID=A0ABQ5H2U8_9ASTR